MEKSHDSNHALYSVIASLNTPEECAQFFEDLCTPKELISLEQRLDVAAFLEQGLPYLEIMARTGASSATISRVRRFMLDNGAGGVMKEVISQHGLNVPSTETSTPLEEVDLSLDI